MSASKRAQPASISATSPSHHRVLRKWGLYVVAFASGATSTSCIIGGSKCDAHQIEQSGDFALCVCEANAVANANGIGCTPCGANETAERDICTCNEGFVKDPDGTGCVASDIGASCSATQACSAPFPYCVASDSGAGYCTTENCVDNADCPSQWTCEAAAGKRYCSKLPSGLNTPCTTATDCEPYVAKYCDTLQSHVCQISGCATGAATCPNAYGCCDYSAFTGMAFSVCVRPEELGSGSCPSGGKLVPR